MNLRSVDLNLLVILDALLDEAHVSRAAERLGLSQPATSQALDRCRLLFRDQLLIRGKGLMLRTSKGDALREPLKELLASALELLSPPQIDIAKIRRQLRIIIADQPAVILIHGLHDRLAKSAPGIDLIFKPWRGSLGAYESLARGDADLAVSVLRNADPAFRQIELYTEHFVVIMRKNHPAATDFSLERWLAYPHIIVSPVGEASNTNDETLARMGLRRRVGMVVPGFAVVPSLVERSDMIGMLPSRFAPNEDDDRFDLREPPIPVESVAVQLVWHRRVDQDPVIHHVVAEFRDLNPREG